MKVKQTVKRIILGALLVFGLTLFALPVVTSAACDPDAANCCGDVETSIIGCEQTGGDGVENSGVWGILLLAINILTAGIGVVAVAGIVYASILYASAGGNAEQTKKAMGIIGNIVIGVIAFAGMWALLNFLIPGGLFE